jgi:hypothetical protein
MSRPFFQIRVAMGPDCAWPAHADRHVRIDCAGNQAGHHQQLRRQALRVVNAYKPDEQFGGTKQA